MEIEVHWRGLANGDEAWSWSRVLYAYLHPQTDMPLYVGKAWGTTVRGRWSAPDKLEGLWKYLNARGIRHHVAIVGDLAFDGRLTCELLADVESLIIHRTQPIGNIASTSSRISRPGLVVRNRGAVWTGPRMLRDHLHRRDAPPAGASAPGWR
jgi:hypothetical protein